MPFTSQWEESGYIARFTNPTNFAEVQNSNRQFHQDGRSDSSKYVIFDLTGVKNLYIDDKDIESIAASDLGASFSLKRLKVALVTDDDSVRNICMHYISIKREFNSPWNYVVFEDIDSAREWVSL